MKLKPKVHNTDGGRSYAYGQLAIPYIKDAASCQVSIRIDFAGLIGVLCQYPPLPSRMGLRSDRPTVLCASDQPRMLREHFGSFQPKCMLRLSALCTAPRDVASPQRN